jgi:hypothetical protein
VLSKADFFPFHVVYKKKDFYLREAIRSRYLAFEYMLLCTVPGLGLASALLLLNHYCARVAELSDLQDEILLPESPSLALSVAVNLR